MGGFGGFWGVVPVFGGGVSYPKRSFGDRLGAGFWFSGRVEADSRMWLSVLGSGVCYGGGSRVLSPLEISGVIAGRGLVVGVGGCSLCGSSSWSKLLGWRRL